MEWLQIQRETKPFEKTVISWESESLTKVSKKAYLKTLYLRWFAWITEGCRFAIGSLLMIVMSMFIYLMMMLMMMMRRRRRKPHFQDSQPQWQWVRSKVRWGEFQARSDQSTRWRCSQFKSIQIRPKTAHLLHWSIEQTQGRHSCIAIQAVPVILP